VEEFWLWALVNGGVEIDTGRPPHSTLAVSLISLTVTAFKTSRSKERTEEKGSFDGAD
jgi:hypothetical protein